MNVFSKKSSQLKFVSIFEGEFELPVKEGTPGAKTRRTKTGNLKTVLAGDALEGMVQYVQIRSNEKFGFELNIKMLINIDGQDQLIVIATSAMHSFAQSFYKRMEGINFSKRVKFETFAKPFEGKIYTYCSVLQSGDRLPNLYKAKLGIPAYKEVTVNGNVTFDKSDAMMWWKEKIESIIQPQFNDPAGIFEPDPDAITADDDDLSF